MVQFSAADRVEEHCVTKQRTAAQKTIPDHSGGIYVSRVLMVFLYFAQFLFIHYCCISHFGVVQETGN